MQVPGTLWLLKPDNVGEARWLWACRGALVGVVDAGLLRRLALGASGCACVAVGAAQTISNSS